MPVTEIYIFGTSFVALRALVREIIPNTIHMYIHTYPPIYIPTWPNPDFHRLFDSGFAPSALSLRLKNCDVKQIENIKNDKIAHWLIMSTVNWKLKITSNFKGISAFLAWMD